MDRLKDFGNLLLSAFIFIGGIVLAVVLSTWIDSVIHNEFWAAILRVIAAGIPAGLIISYAMSRTK